jgi:polynucleotide 5'-kinase involved in rRNA processing
VIKICRGLMYSIDFGIGAATLVPPAALSLDELTSEIVNLRERKPREEEALA